MARSARHFLHEIRVLRISRRKHQKKNCDSERQNYVGSTKVQKYLVIDDPIGY